MACAKKKSTRPPPVAGQYQPQKKQHKLGFSRMTPSPFLLSEHSHAHPETKDCITITPLSLRCCPPVSAKGVRVLGPGDEFGHPFDPDLDLDKPVANFLEYAKAPHLDLLHDDGGEAAPPSRGSGRKDGRAELLVIGRQDWISTLQSCRYVRGGRNHAVCCVRPEGWIE